MTQFTGSGGQPAAAAAPAPAKAGKRKRERRAEAAAVEETSSKPTQKATPAPEPVEVDDDVEEAAVIEDEREAEAEGEGEEEGEEEAEEQLWRSEAYDGHFDVDWDDAALQSRHAALQAHRWTLPGLGAGRALSKDAEAPAPPAALEASLKACGVLPSLRAAWLKAHGEAALSDAQRSLLAVASGYRDVLHTDCGYEQAPELMRGLAASICKIRTIKQR